MTYDVVIIGAGPAGLAAAIYAKRAGLNAVTVERSPISGGQIVNTYEVDNYPGLKGINGMDLGMKYREHADALGCEFLMTDVTGIEKKDKGYVVRTAKGDLESYTVIYAAGADHSKLGVPGEEELVGMGVSYCATCDGAFFKGRDVAVVGGGDVAVEDAIYLARTCNHVYLVHRRDELRAAKMLQDRFLSLPNVTFVKDSVLKSIDGEDAVEKISITNVKDGAESEIKVNGVFIAVGIKPESSLVSGIASMDERGYIIAGESCETDAPGFFAAGDVRTKALRQVVTAVADGANAVTSADAYLLKVKQ